MKILIIGGGPGGYVAALSAVQAGARVFLIEKEHLGGTCVNRGCIPTKALLKAIHPIVELKRYQSMGVDYSGLRTDLVKIRSHAQKAALLSRSGVEYLLKKREVQLIRGEVIGSKEGAVKIRLSDGEEFMENFDKLIIATGSEPSLIPGMSVDGEHVITSDEALLLKKIPETLLVVGGGVIGIEMATIYQALGAKVSIVEMMPQLLPGEDAECSKILGQLLMKMGIQIWTGQKIENIETRPDGCKVCLNKDNTISQEDFEQILIATGRKPSVPMAVLEPLGVTASPKGIPVNPYMQTNHPDVYAIGDVNGVSLLAHTAFKEAKIACSHILSKETPPMNYTTVPRVVYSIPEYASTGDLSKGEVFSFPYAANGRARACNIREGLIKLYVEEGLIVGCAILGENASDMISMATMAIEEKLTLHRLGEIVFPHPTFSEVFADVIEVALGSPIHLA
jgi:dihydrolipoamide dehydrogenase